MFQERRCVDSDESDQRDELIGDIKMINRQKRIMFKVLWEIGI